MNIKKKDGDDIPRFYQNLQQTMEKLNVTLNNINGRMDKLEEKLNQSEKTHLQQINILQERIDSLSYALEESLARIDFIRKRGRP